jgi:hypothetical protein
MSKIITITHNVMSMGKKSFSILLPQIAARETADHIVHPMRPPIDPDGKYL